MSDVFNASTSVEFARRQFRVSVCMVVAIACGAFLMGFIVPVSTHQKATNIEDSGEFIGRLVALGDQ